MREFEEVIIQIIMRCQKCSKVGLDWIATEPIKGIVEVIGLPESAVQFAVDILIDRGILHMEDSHKNTPSLTNLFRLLESMTPVEIWESVK